MNITIMRGTTCSGKDTLIDVAGVNRIHVLSSDDYREILFGDRTHQKGNGHVFDMIHKILEYRLQSRVSKTVLNSTHLSMKECREPLRLAEKYGSEVSVLSIDPPSIDELKRRNEERHKKTGFWIPEFVFEKHYDKYFNCLESFEKFARDNKWFTFNRVKA